MTRAYPHLTSVGAVGASGPSKTSSRCALVGKCHQLQRPFRVLIRFWVLLLLRSALLIQSSAQLPPFLVPVSVKLWSHALQNVLTFNNHGRRQTLSLAPHLARFAEVKR